LIVTFSVKPRTIEIDWALTDEAYNETAATDSAASMSTRFKRTPSAESGIDVCAAARSRVARGVLTPSRARELLNDLAELPIVPWPHGPLLMRVWALRQNVSAYDAVYVAPAEALRAPLVTADGRLARAAAAVSDIKVIAVV